MGWWGDIKNTVWGGLSNVSSAGGSLLGNWFGGPFARIGENFGENIPTSFTLKTTIDGKIQVGVDVAVKVDTTVHFQDLVIAAETLRDGLVRFDMFGGFLRQLGGDLEYIQRIVPLLREIRNTVENGHYEQPTDYYSFSLSLVNKTTGPNSDPLQGSIVSDACGCRVTLTLNGTPALLSRELGIAATQKPVLNSPRLDLEVGAAEVIHRDAPNLLHLEIDRLDNTPGSANLLKNCLLQVRLMRHTSDWNYSVAEWICDGYTDARNADCQFVVGSSTASAIPKASAKASAIANKLTTVIDRLTVPSLTTGVGTTPTTMPELLQTSFLGAYQERILATKALTDALTGIQDENPNTFDLRTPFFVSISCSSGSVAPHVTVADPNDVMSQIDVIKNTVLTVGDELTVQIPLFVGVGVNAKTGVARSCEIKFDNAEGGRATVTVYYGMEWAVRVFHSKTVTIDLGGPVDPYTVDFIVNDALADSA